MSRRAMRRPSLVLATTAATAALLASIAAPAGAGGRPTDPGSANKGVAVQLLAFNDYHGHLEPPSGNDGLVGTTPAGGSAYLASALRGLRSGHENSLTVAAGDLIGGSPFLSGLFHDEPSVESLNAMGLDVSSVGNHEFDEGVAELLRMQHGGCHPEDGCYFPEAPYPGADFQWLAANVVNDETGRTVLPPTWVKKFQGARVGFIGMTLEGTPTLVAQAGIKGWSFLDEATTANEAARMLKRQGVEAIVVLLHEGGFNTGAYDKCVGISGPIVEIVGNLDPEIDMVITGHTHQPYVCSIADPAGQPRLVTSAYSFGRVVTEVNFSIDRRTQDVRRETVSATNHIVGRATADPQVTAIVAKWKALSDTFANEPVGEVAADIKRGTTSSGSENRGVESSLGNLVADAQRWATAGNGAQIAMMNPGGLRADLVFGQSPAGEGDGVVTYGEAFNVQPFGNLLYTIPMSGAQIIGALEDQCQPQSASRPYLQLGVSAGLTYAQRITFGTIPAPTPANPNATRSVCLGVEISDVRFQGEPIGTSTTYLVTTNSFLADGGDNFLTFREVPASARVGGGEDLAALIAYLGQAGVVAPPATDRVTELP